MAQTSGRVNPSAESTGAFFHPASKTNFAVSRTANGIALRWENHAQPLEFFIGSGRMGRSYAFLDNGYLYQAPVGYYTNRRLWDMAPGYERDTAPDFNRPITRECLFCHASGTQVAPGTLNRITNLSSLSGISCERCHGEGAEHSAHPRASNIVNPAKFIGEARDSVCEQCHLAGEARFSLPGKSISDYRPGLPLSRFIDVFVNASMERGIRVNGHADALAVSRCRQVSGEQLWCGSCHQVHASATDYRAKCLTCHQPEQCPSVSAKEANCITCHMPKSRASDGGHTVFTDHSIPRRSTRAGEQQIRDVRPYYTRLLPRSVRERGEGLAYSELARRYQKPEWLEKAWPLLRSAAGAGIRDAALYTQIASMLQADGHHEQAIHYYRMSLTLDTEQITALINLANLLEQQGDNTEAAKLRKQVAVLSPRQLKPK